MLVNKKLEVCVYIKPDNFPLMKCEGVALINSYCFLKNLAKMRGGFYFLLYHSTVLFWFAVSRRPCSQLMAITS